MARMQIEDLRQQVKALTRLVNDMVERQEADHDMVTELMQSLKKPSGKQWEGDDDRTR